MDIKRLNVNIPSILINLIRILLHLISIEHLLTHTSGFDERFLNVRFSKPEMITGLYEDVIGSMPPRVRPPGEVVSYSNYGYALAGHIVEAVSGMEFEEYVEKYILNPINMDRSTFYEPPSGQLLEDMVTTYNYKQNQHVEIPPVYHNQRPAGALYSNIEDLANFAMMNLNGGTYRDVSILNRETVDTMQSVQFMNHTQLEGRGYGFYELSKKGLRIIGHDGDLSGAHTYLFLIPEVNFGMVFHFNTSIGTSIQDDPRRLLVEHFMDRFYPDYSLSQSVVEKSSDITEIANISGHYRITRYVKKSPGKLLNPNILIQFIATQDKDGRVNISQPLGMVETTEWAPYSNDLFYHVDTGDFLAYNKNNKGKVEYLYLNQGAPITLERIAWYERFWVVIALLILPQLVFIGIILDWLISTIYNRVKRKQIIKYSMEIRWSKILIRFMSILGILTFSLLISMILQVMQNLDSSILFLLPAISLMGWILGINSIVLMLLNVKLYKNKEIKRRYSILYSLCATGGLFFTWILYYGNLLWFATS